MSTVSVEDLAESIEHAINETRLRAGGVRDQAVTVAQLMADMTRDGIRLKLPALVAHQEPTLPRIGRKWVVGEPDPTGFQSPFCGARALHETGGPMCAWEPAHDGDHVAGDGEKILAVFDDSEVVGWTPVGEDGVMRLHDRPWNPLVGYLDEEPDDVDRPGPEDVCDCGHFAQHHDGADSEAYCAIDYGNGDFCECPGFTWPPPTPEPQALTPEFEEEPVTPVSEQIDVLRGEVNKLREAIMALPEPELPKPAPMLHEVYREVADILGLFYPDMHTDTPRVDGRGGFRQTDANYPVPVQQVIKTIDLAGFRVIRK